MSHFLNPKDSLLEDLIKNDEYIDKSLLLDKLNSLIDNPCDKLLCVTSPKGFGKTLTLSLISSYYSKGNKTKKLFSSLEISKTKSWNKGINKFNVIKIDLLKEYENSLDKDNFIVHLTNELNKELQEAYPKVNIEKTKAVAHNLFNIFDKKKEKFIILIDNYDVLLRNDILEKERDAYLSFLNGLFKSSVSQNFIHLAYLTGTLPLPKDTIESRLNNFNEYSIIRLRDFAPFIGFNEDEVKLLCSKYDMEYDSCKDWYGGYCCDNGNCLFNPKDVMKGIKEKEYKSYLTNNNDLETFLQTIMEKDFSNVQDDIKTLLMGKKINVDVSTFSSFPNNFRITDEIFTYLIHLGYLTQDEKNGEAWIPNKEMIEEWEKAALTLHL